MCGQGHSLWTSLQSLWTGQRSLRTGQRSLRTGLQRLDVQSLEFNLSIPAGSLSLTRGLLQNFLQLCFELLLGDVFFKVADNFADLSKFLKHLLVVGAALEGVSGGEELSHLVENAQMSKWEESYLLLFFEAIACLFFCKKIT